MKFRVQEANIAERPRVGEKPKAMALRLAREKARKVAASLSRGLVLGADTLVVAGGRTLGKPSSPRNARRMLRLLSGRFHEVYTAVALVDARGRGEVSGIAASRVRFRTLDDDEIRDYVASGEPMDKAAAYAIQGGAGRFIVEVQGSLSNVIGLPLPLLDELLRAAAAAGLC